MVSTEEEDVRRSSEIKAKEFGYKVIVLKNVFNFFSYLCSNIQLGGTVLKITVVARWTTEQVQIGLTDEWNTWWGLAAKGV